MVGVFLIASLALHSLLTFSSISHVRVYAVLESRQNHLVRLSGMRSEKRKQADCDYEKPSTISSCWRGSPRFVFADIARLNLKQIHINRPLRRQMWKLHSFSCLFFPKMTGPAWNVIKPVVCLRQQHYFVYVPEARR